MKFNKDKKIYLALSLYYIIFSALWIFNYLARENTMYIDKYNDNLYMGRNIEFLLGRIDGSVIPVVFVVLFVLFLYKKLDFKTYFNSHIIIFIGTFLPHIVLNIWSFSSENFTFAGGLNFVQTNSLVNAFIFVGLLSIIYSFKEFNKFTIPTLLVYFITLVYVIYQSIITGWYGELFVFTGVFHHIYGLILIVGNPILHAWLINKK